MTSSFRWSRGRWNPVRTSSRFVSPTESRAPRSVVATKLVRFCARERTTASRAFLVTISGSRRSSAMPCSRLGRHDEADAHLQRALDVTCRFGWQYHRATTLVALALSRRRRAGALDDESEAWLDAAAAIG